MAYKDRKKFYDEIEKERGRPLIVYVTSLRSTTDGRVPVSGQMAQDVIPVFAQQIMEIPKENDEIDVLIVSNGGDPTVSWRLISMLRERFKKIGVLLPYAAYSAATLFALGADEIYMHPFANLGPVDPQLTYHRGQKDKGVMEVIQFGAEDLRHYLDFVKTDVGISDQEQLQRAFEMVCRDVGSIPIGVAKRSSYLAISMGEKLLSLHMKDQNKVKAIAESLNKSFYHHGYPLGRTEAKDIGLAIKEPKPKILELMWKVWSDIEKEMECRKQFDPIQEVLKNPRAASLLAPIPQIQIPANLPQNLLTQAYNQIMQQVSTVQVPPVDFELFQSLLESSRCKSEFKTKGKIFATRLPDMRIATSIIKMPQGWL
jgi:hypothetical protein